MDHGKEIRVEIGGVPEAPEFFEDPEFFPGSFKNSGASGQTRPGAAPPPSSRAPDLVSKKIGTVEID